MMIRNYETSDCEAMISLFYNTILCINKNDYTAEQVNAWATSSRSTNEWNQLFMQHITVVAVECNEIVGFGDITMDGYLDHLYVHKEYQRRKIATAICDKLEFLVTARKIFTQSSITAKPFFVNRGYRIVREQVVQCHGVFMKNYAMEKELRK